MNVGSVIICLFLCLPAVVLARGAVRLWRDPELEPADLPMVRAARMSREGQHAVGRGATPLAVGYLALVATVALAASDSGHGRALTRAGLAACGLMLLSWLLFLTVAWFNWPRFIVPPRLRSDTGLISRWRAKRRRVKRGAEQ